MITAISLEFDGNYYWERSCNKSEIQKYTEELKEALNDNDFVKHWGIHEEDKVNHRESVKLEVFRPWFDDDGDGNGMLTLECGVDIEPEYADNWRSILKVEGWELEAI